MKRRHVLTSLLAAAAGLHPSWGLARSRTPYGGLLRLSLPLSLSRIDPHDPGNLAGALFGAALFEPLFAVAPGGQAYPTLVESSPRVQGDSVEIRLREEIRFSDSRPIAALDIQSSIKRSQGMSSVLDALPLPEAAPDGRTLRFFGTHPESVARLLASPRAAIVPRDFNPAQPIGCGALSIKTLGAALELQRNRLCPRGGAFIDGVVVTPHNLTDSLRAFEARRSHLALLGRGLHKQRVDVQGFQLDPLALVLLEPGKGLRSYARPGILEGALSSLPRVPFSALGLDQVGGAAEGWRGPSFSLLVAQDEPWLISIAEEIARSWSRPGTTVNVSLESRPAIQNRRRSDDFDAVLSWLSTANIPSKTTNADLFKLDRRATPRGGRIMSAHEVARQLNLGVVGELRPHGAVAQDVEGLTMPNRLALEHAYFGANNEAR